MDTHKPLAYNVDVLEDVGITKIMEHLITSKASKEDYIGVACNVTIVKAWNDGGRVAHVINDMSTLRTIDGITLEMTDLVKTSIPTAYFVPKAAKYESFYFWNNTREKLNEFITDELMAITQGMYLNTHDTAAVTLSSVPDDGDTYETIGGEVLEHLVHTKKLESSLPTIAFAFKFLKALKLGLIIPLPDKPPENAEMKTTIYIKK